MVGRRRKMLKVHLKRPKMVPKNETWNWKIKYYKPHICNFNFTFSSRNSQSQQKQKKSLILQFCFAQKTSLILRASANSIFKRYTPATKPKTHSLYKIFRKHVFGWCQKRYYTARFLDPQELHSRGTGIANICRFLHISVRKCLFQRSKKLLLGVYVYVRDGGE